MIVYFADRYFNILGQASTDLPEGLTITNDRKVGDVDSGVSVFEFTLPFNEKTRTQAEAFGAVGNYLLRSHAGKQDFYTIIDCEVDTKRQEVTIYAEDAGLDLLNEIVAAYEADKAYNIAHYVNRFIYDSGFVIGVNESGSTTKKLAFTDDATAAERVAAVAEQFGCEISYSFEIDGLAVTKKLVNIFKERGNDVGVQLRLNKEVDRIITKTSIANLATALLPSGGTPENAENPINLSGYKYDDGDIFLEGRYMKSRKAIQKWSRYLNPSEPNTTYTGHILRKFSCDAMTQAALCTAAVAELKRISDVEVNYDIELPALPEGVDLGDRVNIVDDAGELYMSARLLQVEESVANRSVTATIGEYLIKGSGISQKVADLAAQFAASAAEVAAAYQAAQAAKTAAQTAQATAETANQNVASATATATQAAAKADAAQSTAQDAQTAASNAQTAANKADANATNAAKTATNFVEKDADGAVIVGDKSSGSFTGYRAQVGVDSFNVVDADGSPVSTFGANKIELGNNSQDTEIAMCKNAAVIKVDTSEYSGDVLGASIEADSLALRAPNVYIQARTETMETTDEGTFIISRGSLCRFQPASVSLLSSIGQTEESGAFLGSAYSEINLEYNTISLSANRINLDGTIVGDITPEVKNISATGTTDAMIQSVYDAMGNGTFKTIRLAQSVQDSLPVGGTWFVTIYKTNATYGVVTAIRYYAATAPAVVEYRRALYAGTWSSWEKVGGASIDTGTWTARLNAGTITTQQCTYQKVGDMCTISFFIQGTGVAASTGGNYLYIGGVPYTPRSGASWYGGGGHMQGLRIDSGHYPTGPIIQPNGLIYYRTAQSASTSAAGGYAHIANGSATFYITGSITYPVAE